MNVYEYVCCVDCSSHDTDITMSGTDDDDDDDSQSTLLTLSSDGSHTSV